MKLTYSKYMIFQKLKMSYIMRKQKLKILPETVEIKFKVVDRRVKKLPPIKYRKQ